jgi:hypothetical protein
MPQLQTDLLALLAAIIIVNIVVYVIVHKPPVKVKRKYNASLEYLNALATMAIKRNVDLYCPNCHFSQLEEHLFCDSCETQYQPYDIRQQLYDYMDDLNEHEHWLKSSEGTRSRWSAFVAEAARTEHARRIYRFGEAKHDAVYVTCEFCLSMFDVVHLYCPNCNTPNGINVTDLHNFYEGEDPDLNGGKNSPSLGELYPKIARYLQRARNEERKND